MRCKEHFTDLSSNFGVCASCLRERLFTLIEAQAQAQLQAHVLEDHRKSDAYPAPLLFPRSVSPYISRRKSNSSHHQHTLSDHRFYSTPQVGPNGGIIAANLYKKRHGKFSLLSNLFRSKTQSFELDPNLDPKSREPCSTPSTTSSPSWFSNIFPGRRKNKARMVIFNDPNVGGGNRRPCRGMSPARELDEECGDGSSGYSSDSSQGLKETPRMAAQPVRRPCGPLHHTRNVSGLAFCLSPLVRASPNRHWNQKGMPPEIAVSGEIRVPVKPQLGVAAAFRANRSRKLANFGRYNPNY